MPINKSKFWDEALETQPREELEAKQLADLKEIVQFAYDNAPYYKRSFDEAGVKPSDIKTLKDIEKFPFINKKTQRDTQGVGSFLGELCAVPEDDVVFISTSSGSTGVPTISPFTAQDFEEFQETEARWFWQVGMRPSDRYVHALNFSLYVGGPDVIGAQKTGALCIWGGTLPSERLLWVLKTYQPSVIWTSPSYAWQLGEKALKSGIDPKKDLNIKTIIVAGELGGSIDATRKAIEDLWGLGYLISTACQISLVPVQLCAKLKMVFILQRTTSWLKPLIQRLVLFCHQVQRVSLYLPPYVSMHVL